MQIFNPFLGLLVASHKLEDNLIDFYELSQIFDWNELITGFISIKKKSVSSSKLIYIVVAIDPCPTRTFTALCYVSFVRDFREFDPDICQLESRLPEMQHDPLLFLVQGHSLTGPF